MDVKCFALFNNGCRILTVVTCVGSRCSFYKTSDQYEKSRKKANARVAGLDYGRQIEIAQKYYNGKMPWQEGGDCCDS